MVYHGGAVIATSASPFCRSNTDLESSRCFKIPLCHIQAARLIGRLICLSYKVSLLEKHLPRLSHAVTAVTKIWFCITLHGFCFTADKHSGVIFDVFLSCFHPVLFRFICFFGGRGVGGGERYSSASAVLLNCARPTYRHDH